MKGTGQFSLKHNLAGRRFERWTVLTYSGRGLWNCVCDCGVERKVNAAAMVEGRTKSCGCLSAERASIKNRTHGLTKSRAYKIWANMKARCSKPNHKDYHNYGGRGIRVCERWSYFENFIDDMGHPEDGMTLDRIDNDGNYEASNCRWTTRLVQGRNKRNNNVIEFNGESRCIKEWAEIVGIMRPTIERRLKSGWSVKDALTLPATGIRINKRIEYNGELLALTEWAKRYHISKNTLRTRLDRGWTMERALSNGR